jgi:hypothetical protein
MDPRLRDAFFLKGAEAITDLKRRVKLRELRRAAGDDVLFIGSEHPEAIEISNRYRSIKHVSPKHAELVDKLSSFFAVDKAKVEEVLAQTGGDVDRATEILCPSS